MRVLSTRLRGIPSGAVSDATLERLYATELSPTHDAEEGVRAFVEKRAPRWEDR